MNQNQKLYQNCSKGQKERKEAIPKLEQKRYRERQGKLRTSLRGSLTSLISGREMNDNKGIRITKAEEKKNRVLRSKDRDADKIFVLGPVNVHVEHF